MSGKLYYDIDDASYYFEIEGHGTPIVLLHGFTGSSETWAPFVDHLKDEYQLITVDLPGHGKTRTHTPRTMERCCSDLAQLLDNLHVTHFHLIGYSMGGRTALSFAMRYPEKLKTLILESASPGLKLKEDREHRMINDHKLAEKIETEGIRSFTDFWENIPLFHTQKNLPDSVKEKIRRERLNQNESGLSESLRYMGTGVQPSWWERLGSLLIPVLLIVGEHDLKFVKINEEMKNLFPFAELKRVEDAGHAIHIEKPDIFKKLVSSFIKEHSDA